MEKQWDVFLSYARPDIQIVEALDHLLAQGASLKVWFDKRLSAAVRWDDAIRQGIEQSRTFIACLTPCSVSREGFVHAEVAHALACAERLPEDRRFILPVRLGPCRIPRRLSDWNCADLAPHSVFGVRNGMMQLLSGLSGALGAEIRVMPDIEDDFYRSLEKASGYILVPEPKGKVTNPIKVTYAIRFLPDDLERWIAVRVNNLYWPKIHDGGPIDYQSGRCECSIEEHGSPPDGCFHICLLSVPVARGDEFRQWQATGAATGNWPGLSLPQDVTVLHEVPVWI